MTYFNSSSFLKAATSIALVTCALHGCGEPAAPAAQSVVTVKSTVQAADQTRIAYQAQGQGDLALVFVHGWSCDASYWSEQISEFARDFRVVTLDLAGHGASDASRTNWSIAAFAEEVVAVLRALPDQRIILIGHSMGGPVVVEAARLAPDRIIGVIGVDTMHDLAGSTVPSDFAAQLVANLRQDSTAATRTFVTDNFFQPNTDPALVSRIAEDMASAPSMVAVASMDALLRYDIKAAASQLTVPITAINSDLELPMDEEAARRVVPQFRLVTMTKVGHFPQLETPQRFNTTLLSEVEHIRALATRTVIFHKRSE